MHRFKDWIFCIQIGSQWHAVETNCSKMVQDSKTTTREGVAGCKTETQCMSEVEANGTLSLTITAGERRSSLRMVFENKWRFQVMKWGPGPSRDWAWWGFDGWWAARPWRRERGRGDRPSRVITVMFYFLNLLMYFRFFLLKEVASEHMSNIPHAWLLEYFVVFNFLSKKNQ